jgi:hypothetical protein
MSVRKSPVRAKAPFAVKQGPLSGTVKLTVKAAASRASYEWEWSGNGGSTWTPVLPTLVAKTTIASLPVATSCEFRFRATTKAGVTDWSQPITLLVK